MTNPFNLPLLPPAETLAIVRKSFVAQFEERRRKEAYYVSNHAIIKDILSDEKWGTWGEIHSYSGARKVLNKYLPGWNKEKKNPK